MDLLYPIKFTPQSKYRIWGGDNLKTKYGKPFKNDKIGESWEISTVPNSISRVSNGFLKGKRLDELIKKLNERYDLKNVNFLGYISNKEEFFNNYFNKLAGNKILKNQIVNRITEEKIIQSWQKKLDIYKKMRMKYLIYN